MILIQFTSGFKPAVRDERIEFLHRHFKSFSNKKWSQDMQPYMAPFHSYILFCLHERFDNFF